jgi:TetR/AcrR family transcriptional repressor of nem operon
MNKVDPTKTSILDSAEGLLQQKGFNGFSYKDIAAIVGIKTASIHYHYPSKGDLATALVSRYDEEFLKALADIEVQHPDALSRLKAFGAIFKNVLYQDHFCLCGMLAAEVAHMPERVTNLLKQFFEHLTQWLTAQLEQLNFKPLLLKNHSHEDRAKVILVALEGALLIARATRDPSYLDQTLSFFLLT